MRKAVQTNRVLIVLQLLQKFNSACLSNDVAYCINVTAKKNGEILKLYTGEATWYDLCSEVKMVSAVNSFITVVCYSF